MIFNIVGRNQDDHAKNFAFTMDKNGLWNLSPAYDITYANGSGYTKNHQLSLAGKVNDFTLKDILEVAKKHSIKESFAKESFEQIVDMFCSFQKRAEKLDIKTAVVAHIQNELRIDF
jgi:serine/threonine-protein kinase HipA